MPRVVLLQEDQEADTGGKLESIAKKAVFESFPKDSLAKSKPQLPSAHSFGKVERLIGDRPQGRASFVIRAVQVEEHVSSEAPELGRDSSTRFPICRLASFHRRSGTRG